MHYNLLHAITPKETFDTLIIFYNDIKYIDGDDNIVAGAVSRMELNYVSAKRFDLKELAGDQATDLEVEEITSNPSLRFENCPL